MVYAADFSQFKDLAQTTIAEVQSGKIKDINKLIAMQEKMMVIGSKACEEFALKNPGNAKMLKLVSENADSMKKLSLSEIEDQWHEKNFLRSKGIEAAQLEEKSLTGSLMDTVVHPATAYIALNQYKQTKDAKLLEQVKDELDEVLHHVERIK